MNRPDEERIRAVHRRSRIVLISGQILAGVGMGATFSAGALLAADVSGSPAWSGAATTVTTLGAAGLAVPLAALARRRGRAPALATGALIAAAGAAIGLVGASIDVFALLLLGFALMGAGVAVNLQSRFAATDLSAPGRRGRDLAIVVWATTVGAVIGPNLIEVADQVGATLGIRPLAGVFVFAVAAQLAAASLYLLALRPDPLQLAQHLGATLRGEAGHRPEPEVPAGVRMGILTVASSQAVMASVMAMTPIHLVEHGASLTVVGITISLHVAGMYALSPVFGWLSDRMGRGPVIVLGQALFLAALLMTALGAEQQTWVQVGLVLLGLGWSASVVAGAALVAESAGSARRTTIQGRSDLFMNVAGALGGAGAGPVLQAFGYSVLSFVAMGLAVTVLVLVAVRPPAPRVQLAAEPVPPAE